MDYHFAPKANYQDFASGHVIRSRPGMSAFPVRLASELFSRAAEYLRQQGYAGPYHLYDPVCGGGFSLTALGFLHRPLISRISASEIDNALVPFALSNLSLLTNSGLKQRQVELESLVTSYGRKSHMDAIQSLQRLQSQLAVPFQDSHINIFQANALNAQSMQKGLISADIDITFADVPYGNCAHWSGADRGSTGESRANDLLDALSMLQNIPKIIILATSKQEKPTHPSFRRIKIFQSGTRRLSILTYSKEVPDSRH